MGKMNFDDFQQAANRTSGMRGGKPDITIAALGLAGESGEVADLVKKWLGHGHDLDREKVLEELGDILWYLAEFVSLLNGSLSDVAADCIAKLEKRYPDGFSHERSLNRA